MVAGVAAAAAGLIGHRFVHLGKAHHQVSRRCLARRVQQEDRYDRTGGGWTAHVHKLGRRRVVALRRDSLAQLGQWVADLTEEALIRQWWAPAHFEVADCVIRPEPGGEYRIVFREGDGSEYVSEGHFTRLDPPTELEFTLSPLTAGGTPMLASRHTITLVREGSGSGGDRDRLEPDAG